MNMRLSLAISAAFASGVFWLATPAFAQCTVPNTITNGTPVDASDLNDNFDALADCTDEAVNRDGFPKEGSIAVFTGNRTIGSGDLSGDATTNGSAVTTLTPSGVAPGNYTLVDVTVDAKGRITAAASGALPGGPFAPWTELALTNPNAETGDSTGWTAINGGFNAWTTTTNGMVPIEGSYAFKAANNGNPKMYQTVDLSAYAAQIDAGNLSALVEAYACDTYNPGELPFVYLEFLDASDNIISQQISEEQPISVGLNVWRYVSAMGQVPAQTRSVRVYIWGKRQNGSNTDVAFDLIRAFIRGA